MNLVQQAEQLKSIPEQELVRLQQAPSSIPPYLVVAEMQRRASMRKAYQGAQAMQQPQQPPVAQQLAQPMQQQQPQPQGQAPPMAMAGGGLANLAGYFSQMQGGQQDGGSGLGVEDMSPYFDQMSGPQEMPSVDSNLIGANDLPSYSSLTDASHNAFRQQMKVPLNKARGVAANLKELQGLTGESPLKAVADKYGADEEKYRNKKMGLGEILMNLGLSMAASRRPDFLGALGEGGVGALQGWRQDKDRNVSLANQAASKRLQAMEGIQRHNDRLQDYAIDANRTEQSGYNVDRQYNNSIEAMLQKEVLTGDRERSMTDRQAAAAASLDERARANDVARSRREMALEMLKQSGALDVARIRAASKGKGGGGNSNKETNDAIRNINGLADDYARSAEHYETMAEKIQPMSLKPDDPALLRKNQLLMQANQLREKAMAMRERHQELVEGSLPGASKKPKGSSDLGTGALAGLGKVVNLMTFGKGKASATGFNPNAATIQIPGPPQQQQQQQYPVPSTQQPASSLGVYNPSQYGPFQSFVDSFNRSGAPR